MSLFTKLGNDIAAPVDAAGNKRSVENIDFQRWMTEVERATLAFQAGGGIIFPDLATANASLAYAQNQMAWVIGDPVPANNGVYRKIGASGSGSWARLGDLPISMIRLDNAGAGTADAIIAEPMLPLPTTPGAALLTVNILAANTGSVTLNGKPLRTNSGNEIAPGGLTAGSIHAFLDLGDHFRLLSDQASAAIVAAAEAARDAAMSAVPNAFPATRAALKELDTNSITAAYLTEPGWEGQWLWDGTVPVATHQADTFEQRYIAPSPAEDGAFVRAGAIPTGGFFVDQSPAPRIERFADRLLVGGAADYDGGSDYETGEFSWLGQTDRIINDKPQPNIGWMELNSHFAAMTRGHSIAATFGANTKDLEGGAATFGIAASMAAVNDNEVDKVGVQAMYLDAKKYPDAGTTWGAEWNITNLGTYIDQTCNLTTTGGEGPTRLFHLAAGGDVNINGITEDVSVAMMLAPNGSRFGRGITFHPLVLRDHIDPGVDDGATHNIAIESGIGSSWRWLNTDDDVCGWIRCWNFGSASAVGLELGTGWLSVKDIDGNHRHQFTNGASPAHYINEVQVLGERKTGWAQMYGTKSRATLDADAATAAQVAARLAALIDDLFAHGIIGA